MLEFDSGIFRQMMRAIPEQEKTTPIHSEYLQTQVFDKLRAEEAVQIKDIDWNEINDCHVTPAFWQQELAGQVKGWARGFRSFVKKVDATPSPSRKFF